MKRKVSGPPPPPAIRVYAVRRAPSPLPQGLVTTHPSRGNALSTPTLKIIGAFMAARLNTIVAVLALGIHHDYVLHRTQITRRHHLRPETHTHF